MIRVTESFADAIGSRPCAVFTSSVNEYGTLENFLLTPIRGKRIKGFQVYRVQVYDPNTRTVGAMTYERYPYPTPSGVERINVGDYWVSCRYYNDGMTEEYLEARFGNRIADGRTKDEGGSRFAFGGIPLSQSILDRLRGRRDGKGDAT